MRRSLNGNSPCRLSAKCVSASPWRDARQALDGWRSSVLRDPAAKEPCAAKRHRHCDARQHREYPNRIPVSDCIGPGGGGERRENSGSKVVRAVRDRSALITRQHRNHAAEDCGDEPEARPRDEALDSSFDLGGRKPPAHQPHGVRDGSCDRYQEGTAEINRSAHDHRPGDRTRRSSFVDQVCAWRFVGIVHGRMVHRACCRQSRNRPPRKCVVQVWPWLRRHI